jgi:hypothetical protein
MIISILILILGLGSLVQFAIAYCRTLLLAYSKVEVSDRAYAVAGIEASEVSYDDFDRLIRLAHMAPDPEDDSAEIVTVRIYYRAMRLLRWLIAPLSARLTKLAECELTSCSYFAAVTLDRRLTPISE